MDNTIKTNHEEHIHIWSLLNVFLVIRRCGDCFPDPFVTTLDCFLDGTKPLVVVGQATMKGRWMVDGLLLSHDIGNSKRDRTLWSDEFQYRSIQDKMTTVFLKDGIQLPTQRANG